MQPLDEKTLLNLFWPPVVQLDKLYLLASEIPKTGIDLTQFHDLTAAEAFYNHIHILDCFQHDADFDGSDAERGFFDKHHPDFMAACELGRLVASVWRAKLMSDFPNQQFRVYYTADDNPAVRFHLVRPEESSWLDESTWPTEVAAGRVVVLSTPADSLEGRHN